MAEIDPKRIDLTRFSKQEIGVGELIQLHPACACEKAISPDGSHGPVQNNELLRFFITSRSDVDLKRQPGLATNRPFKVASLKKAYSNGLSVCRVEHASEKEVVHTAKLIYDNQVANDKTYGGLIAVVDFPADAVRSCPAGVLPMCVHETPLDPDEVGDYSRPSHADIVSSAEGASDVERKHSREAIYNQIQELAQHIAIEDVDIPNLEPYLPDFLCNKETDTSRP